MEKQKRYRYPKLEIFEFQLSLVLERILINNYKVKDK